MTDDVAKVIASATDMDALATYLRGLTYGGHPVYGNEEVARIVRDRRAAMKKKATPEGIEKRQRTAKDEAHKAFDRLWRQGVFTRGEAYRWLARMLEIHPSECHFGRFDDATCRRIVQLCRPDYYDRCRQWPAKKAQ